MYHMTGTELIVKAQERIPQMTLQQVSVCCSAILETIFEALASERTVTLPRLGEFTVKKHHARVGRDSRNGQERMIPSCAVVQFNAHKNLKEKLNARQLSAQARLFLPDA